MTKAVIVGHKSVLKRTIDSLHASNLLHIEDFIEDESGFKISKPFQNAEEVSKKLVKIRSIANYLGIERTTPAVQKTNAVLRELDAKLDKLDSDISEKIKIINKYETDLKNIEAQKKELLPFLSLNLDFDYYRGYENLKVFAGSVKENLEEGLISRVTQAYELFFDVNTKTVVLFVAKKDADKVAEVLQALEFKELRIPERGGVPSELLKETEQKEAEASRKIVSLKAEVESIRSQYTDFLLASDEVLSI
jgi:V/A-type H+-transporting ATPase subunit I